MLTALKLQSIAAEDDMFKTISAVVGIAVISGSLAFAGQAPAATPGTPATPSGSTPSATPAPPQTQADGSSQTPTKKHRKHKKHHKKHAAALQTPPATADGAK
jgi:hypothetical protein